VALFAAIPPPPAGSPPSEGAALAAPPPPPGPPPPAAFPPPATMAILQRWLLHCQQPTHAANPYMSGENPSHSGPGSSVAASAELLPIPADRLGTVHDMGSPAAAWLKEGEYKVNGIVYMDGTTALQAGVLVVGVAVQVIRESSTDGQDTWQAGILQAVQEFQVPHTDLTLTKLIVQSPPESRLGEAFPPEDVRAVLGPEAEVKAAREQPQHQQVAGGEDDISSAAGAAYSAAEEGGVDSFFSGDGWQTVEASVVERAAAAAQEAATQSHLHSLTQYAAGDESAVAPPSSAAEAAPAGRTPRGAADEDLHAYGAVDALAAFSPMGQSALYKGVRLQQEAGPPAPAPTPADAHGETVGAQAVFKKRAVVRRGKRKRS